MCNEKDYLSFSSNGDNNNFEQGKIVLTILKKYRKEFSKMKSEIISFQKETVFPQLLKVIARLLDVFSEEDKKIENASKNKKNTLTFFSPFLSFLV